MTKQWKLLVVFIGLGIVNTLIFKAFEAIVNNGSNWIWNDLFHSNTNRWVVIPLAVGLSILLTVILTGLKQKRWTKPVINVFSGSKEDNHKTTIGDIGSIIAQGISSLLAGASLGPEMSLTESSTSIGKWLTDKLKVDSETGALLVVCSVGALMVSFFGSLVLVLLPFALIFKKAKRIPGTSIIPVLLTCLSAYGMLWLIDHHTKGYGTIPASPQTSTHDYIGAIITAFLVSILAFGLIKSIDRLTGFTKKLDINMPWYITATLFGLVIGVFYLIGGQTVEFSGSMGSTMLVNNSAHYGTWALLGLALVKLAVTGWSKVSGYRGGLIFPSIYIGVAISLFTDALITPLAGSGVMVGAIAGIFIVLTGSPALALVVLVAMLPIKLLPLAILAIVIASSTNKLIAKVAK